MSWNCLLPDVHKYCSTHNIIASREFFVTDNMVHKAPFARLYPCSLAQDESDGVVTSGDDTYSPIVCKITCSQES
jgi:hypothetical protein